MYKLYFDGASRGNPGKSSYGGVIITPFDTEFKIYNGVLPNGTTNNEAEYIALLKGLEYAVEYCIKELDVYGDSKLVISQINGLWQVKHPNMIKYHSLCKELLDKFDVISFNHIDRKYNKRADALANYALDYDKIK